jgi:hypothetical protein
VRLITANEELALVEDESVAIAADAVAVAVLRWGDADAYRAAVDAFRYIPDDARWIVELIVEAELAANAIALRYPSGIRGKVSQP